MSSAPGLGGTWLFRLAMRAPVIPGGGKGVDVFMGTYVHVHNAARLVADRFNGVEFEVL